MIVTADDVAAAPVLSVAFAVSEYDPGATFVHIVVNGDCVTVAIEFVPTRNCTDVIGTVPPDALALMLTVVPAIDAPDAGAVMATVGTRSRPSCITCARNM